MGFGAAFAYAQDTSESTAAQGAGAITVQEQRAPTEDISDTASASGASGAANAGGATNAEEASAPDVAIPADSVAADTAIAGSNVADPIIDPNAADPNLNDPANLTVADGLSTLAEGEAGSEGFHPFMLSSGFEVLARTTWYAGHESDASYTLANAEDLAGLAELVNAGTSDFTGKTLTLSANLLNVSLPPIGTPEHPFNGTFDGGSKTITNLGIVTENRQYVGLFGYGGASALIKNVRLVGGMLTVSEPSQTGSEIKYVGTIAGNLAGSIENCSSSMGLTIDSKLQATTETVGVIRHIGGLVGRLMGNMTGCSHAGSISVASTSNVLEEMRYLAGELGGLVGSQGDLENLSVVPKIEDSSNTGNISFNLTGSGGKDRFGEQLLSISSQVGGIVGATTGSVSRCVNSGDVNTSNGTALAPKEGLGAANTGGIVGSLRSNSFDKTAVADPMTVTGDAGYNAWAASQGVTAPPKVGIYDCKNTGIVVGLTSVGGIVGATGSFTEVEGSGNTGAVKGCRWNKPFVGGVVGTSRGDIRYSYNRGSIYSVTGGGYYCCGIAGNFTDANVYVTEDALRIPTIEMTGCYVTGQIYTSSPGFRTAVLAGESNGYIHANAYLPNLSPDNKLVELNAGTLADNLECSTADLRGNKGIAKLNTWAASAGRWSIFYLPDNANTNGGYPVPSRVTPPSVSGATNINTISAVPSKTANAAYTSALDPIPAVSITSSQGALTQNADFRVIAQSGARAVSDGVNSYTATIEGIGNYTGILSATVAYGIDKGDISQCTIVTAKAIFNWERQDPAWVRLIDSSGNEVASSEYTWETLPNADKSPALVGGKFYDYVNAHEKDYKYPVKVTATSISNYIGTTIQDAFSITTADMAYSDKESDPPRPESVRYDKVVWQGQDWDFITAMNDKSGATVSITYTGSEIKPTVANVTYLGRTLRNGTGQPYWDAPFDYDYKYVYGNPNPEEGGGTDGATPINVTPDSAPGCMTIRFTNAGNFSSYANVFYRITPASLDSVSAAAIPAIMHNGSAVRPDPTLTYNGMTLVKDTDYTLSYANNNAVGTAQVTVVGRGNYTGTKVLSFEIQPAPPAQNLTGWNKIGDSWYYYNADHSVYLGWLLSGGSWYYLDPAQSGRMLTGLQRIGGDWFLFAGGDSGNMLEGWQYGSDGFWRYFATGGSGRAAIGWLYQGGSWYYLDSSDGRMLEGLQRIGGSLYYLQGGGSGRMLEGWQRPDGIWRYFHPGSGHAASGWLSEGGSWYYLDLADGRMLEGWQTINEGGVDVWYYLYPGNGRMAVGTVSINGADYTFAQGGALISPVPPFASAE
jgi:glucan-binding YG repeat protein